MQWPPVMQGLLQGAQGETGMGGPRRTPSDDAAGLGIDDEGHANEAGPCGDIGEIRKPEPIRCRSTELAVHLVEWARSGLVADRCAHRFAANDTLQAKLPHQSLHRASRNIEPFPLHLSPDLADAIDREVLGKDPHDLRLERFIALCTGRQP